MYLPSPLLFPLLYSLFSTLLVRPLLSVVCTLFRCYLVIFPVLLPACCIPSHHSLCLLCDPVLTLVSFSLSSLFSSFSLFSLFISCSYLSLPVPPLPPSSPSSPSLSLPYFLIVCIMGGIMSKKEDRLLMVGLDGAGKVTIFSPLPSPLTFFVLLILIWQTTILYKLKLGEVTTTIPTIGFCVETITYNNFSFVIWDIGGQEKVYQFLFLIFFYYLFYILSSSSSFNIFVDTYVVATLLPEHVRCLLCG